MDDCLCLSEEPEGRTAFVQYKGTRLCADFECDCGAHLHTDEMFAYAIQCVHCQRIYELQSYIRVFPRNAPCEWHKPILLADDELECPHPTIEDYVAGERYCTVCGVIFAS